MILKLTSTTGICYVNFDKVACWREWFEASGQTTRGRGSIIIFDDADHFEIMVNETPDQINNLLKGTNEPAPAQAAVEAISTPGKATHVGQTGDGKPPG